MDRDRLSLLGHAGMDGMSPVPLAALERLFDIAGLAPDDDVVDIGAGKGAVSVIALKWGARVTLVERSPLFAALARDVVAKAGFADSAHVVQDDARAFVEAARFPIDMAICVGSSHALGGRDEALSALSRLVMQGGSLLFGEGHWRKKPSPEYLRALGASEDELGSLEDTVAAAEARGFRPLAVEIADGERFDHYERAWCENLARFAKDHPDDPDAAEIQAIAAHRLDLYERWGQAELGFAVHLFARS